MIFFPVTLLFMAMHAHIVWAIFEEFQSKDRVFHTLTTMASSALQDTEKSLICKQFYNKEEIEARDEIDLVYVPSKNVSVVPVFPCQSYATNLYFYVTYFTRSNEYFRLEHVQGGKYEVTDTKRIDFFTEFLSNVTAQGRTYFYNKDYQTTASNVLSNLISNNDWPKLCDKFYPNYSSRLKIPKNIKIKVAPVTIYNGSLKINIPYIQCSFVTENYVVTDLFYVAHFIRNIFFKIVTTTGRGESVTYDVAKYP